MPIKNQQVHVVYYAYDATGPKTGDAANHVLRIRRDGSTVTPTNTPTEIDASNAPGYYELLITASENTGRSMALIGKSNNVGVNLTPVFWTNEHNVSRYDNTLSPGEQVLTDTATKLNAARVDVAISSRADGAHYTEGRATKLDNLDATISSRATNAGVWAHATRTLTEFSFVVDINMSQTLPANPTADTTGRALKHADSRIDAAITTRADAAHYTNARAANLDNLNATVSSRATASDVWNHATRTLTAFAFTVDVNMSQTLPDNPTANTTGRALKHSDTRLDATVASRLASTAYVAPDNAGIAAIKSQTDKMQFNAQNHILAHAMNVNGGGGGGGGTTQVIVQPLQVEVQQVAYDAGTITGWKHARLVASWHVDQDVTGHDLRLIIFRLTDASKVAEYSGTEITVTQQTVGWLISVNGADSKTPAPGTYGYIMRDQTTDTVILQGRLRVFDAPDAA